ncbi:STAS domain-containing protein [Halomonas sp. HP20-15]|uniref:STAS domain-containing protein n=1 Tax=Halomonas sp. HP20-15 TaxID=3085901 RepID=UPI0029818523|nr:STAS domain-containing protein [Halomonas sp. HP20-15]MDW5378638.1 STAS domain-containing protein [Halomonas sp. HP20-15]
MSVLLDHDGARLVVQDQALIASGEADFDVAASLAESGCEWLDTQPSGSVVHFDLSGVDRASSAAISVMLEWLRCARKRGLEVESVKLSEPLVRVTSLAGIDLLLPSHLEAAEA